ncbi:MAG: hypothetical protein AMXMBFR84_40290 [Candidatus Hydrogenedentota bacterium]
MSNTYATPVRTEPHVRVEAGTPEQAAGSRAARFGSGALVGVIVLFSGAAVMVYEFLAVRILQRFFGSALETWAAEIAVVLAALALGYALGGWMADRFRSWHILGGVLVWAGLWGFPMERFIEWASHAVASETAVRWWEPLFVAWISSFFLFLGLGTVMPQAVRLYIRDVNHAGKTTGWVAALSTVGSIAGVLLTVYALIPKMDVRTAIFGTSVALVVFGGLIMVSAWLTGALKRRTAAVLAAMAFVSAAQADVIYERYSAYHHILVADTASTRTLYFDEDPQSIMNVNEPTSGGFEYTEYFHLPFVFDPTIDNVLFVGLGGATGPKVFLRDHPSAKLTAVEIDPVVVEVAKTYFMMPEDPKLQIATLDGRVFLQRSRQEYGAIIMDAYGSGPKGAYLPYHLATREFFELARDRIRNGGCLVYNVMGSFGGINDDIVRGMMITLEQVFPHVYAFKAKSSANTVFVAVKLTPSTSPAKAWPQGPWVKHPLKAEELARLTERIRAEGLALPPAFESRVRQTSEVQLAPRSGQVFTDNYAPVDLGPGMRN